MEQKQLMLLNYLLLFLPIKLNSSGVIATAPTSETSTTAHHLHRLNESTTPTSLYSRRARPRPRLRRRHKLTTFHSASLAPVHRSLRMGSCFGSLLTKEPSATATSAAACLWRHTADDQESQLMKDADEDEMNPKKTKLIFRIMKYKRQQKRKQFMEKFWQHHDANYSALSSRNSNNDSASEIQLQNLDVNNLLTSSNALAAESVINAFPAAAAVPFSSRTSSSLDLEWEHEYSSHMRPYPLALLPAAKGATTTAKSAGLIVSTPSEGNVAANGLDSWQFLSQCRYFDEEPMNSAPATASHLESAAKRTVASLSTASELDPLRRLPGCGNAAQTKQHSNSSCKLQPQQTLLRPAASFTRTSSHNSCSHISTPESLEWDIDEEQQRQLHVEDDNLGLETLQLLHQIEQLKNKVLNETGDGLSDAGDDLEGFSNVRTELLEEIDTS